MTRKVERSRLELSCWSVALLVSAVAPASAQRLTPAPLPVSDSIRVPALFRTDGRLAIRVATPTVSKWSGPLVLAGSAAFTATVAGVATTMRSPCS